jgi:hypothetical protein
LKGDSRAKAAMPAPIARLALRSACGYGYHNSNNQGA